MREFFQGWRRTFGVVTLVLALVFMAAWVRSFGVDDFLNASAGGRFDDLKHNLWSLVSADGTLFIGKIWSRSSDAAEFHDSEKYYRYPRWQSSYDADFPDGDLKHNWRLCGFGVYERCPDDPFNGGLRLMMPYWSIVLPLTLVSAWLLLPRSRRSTSKKTDEPTANEREATP